ncbi:restriction modification system DNA specificity domain protein [Clostridium sp. CAG:1193]|nr:restriction modification system DNA specificity domain protein [Clostridium sp. CAG:1193]
MEIKKLSELCNAIIDCPHSTPEWKTSGIPVIRNYNLVDGNIDIKNLSYVDESTYNSRVKRAKPEEGDIIISREAPMGVVGIVPPNFKCCLGQRLVLLKINKERYNPYYILNILRSNYVQTQIHRVDKTGSIVSNLNIPDLENLDIPIIDDSQDDKAKILKNINDNILLNNKIIETLNSIGDTLYNYWFTQYAYVNENLEFSDICKRKVPKSWIIKNITELCDLKKGYEPGSDNYLEKSIDNSVQFFRVSDLDTKNPIYILDDDSISSRVNYDEVLISFDGSVGRVGIGYDGVFSTGIKKAVSLNKEISNGLLYFLFRSEYVRKTIEKYASGSVLKHASSSIPYINFPYEEKYFANFSQLINPLFSEIVLCIKEIEKLKRYYNFLLPLMVNGQIKIED